MNNPPSPRKHVAKLTSKNQLPLPAAVVAAMGHPSHFRVQVLDSALVLMPGHVTSTEEVCAKLSRKGMPEAVVEAVRAVLGRTVRI